MAITQRRLESMDRTDSGAIRKADAMPWLESLDDPDPESLLDSVIPKPDGHTGSTYPEPISTIRLTGDADFVTEAAKLFRSMAVFEDADTRLAINLQEIHDRETDEPTGNFALYLSVAERG